MNLSAQDHRDLIEALSEACCHCMGEQADRWVVLRERLSARPYASSSVIHDVPTARAFSED